jgi:LysR family transcriptional regulator for metE and metH
MRPTDAGRVLVKAAQQIDELLLSVTAEIDALRGLSEGIVTVGVVSTAKYFAPQAMAGFSKLHPGVELRLLVGNRHEIIAALGQLDIDVAIMGRPPDELAVDCFEFGINPHVVIAPPEHRLARAKRLSARDLAQDVFLLREPGSGTRLLMERLFRSVRMSPKTGIELGSNETIKQAVMAGMGIALISAHTVALEIEHNRLVVLDIAGLPIDRQWFVVRHTSKRLLPAPQAFLEFMRERGKGYLPRLSISSRSRHSQKR